MKLRDVFLAAPLALALTACGSSSTATPDTSTTTTAGATTVVNPPTATSGSSLTIVGSSGSSGSGLNANGCPQYPQHPLYQYPNLQGTGSGPVFTTPNDITADSKLRVSIVPGNANGTSGTGASANYNFLSADVHLVANGGELASFTIAGTGVTAPNGSTYPIGIPVNQTSNPALADFSSYLTGSQKYSIQVDNIKTDYKCNQYATFAYYQTQGDCMYYYNPGYGEGTCYYNWNYDYHTANWACCYTNMLEQAQQMQCGVGTPDSGASFSVTVEVETDSTPCITGG